MVRGCIPNLFQWITDLWKTGGAISLPNEQVGTRVRSYGATGNGHRIIRRSLDPDGSDASLQTSYIQNTEDRTLVDASTPASNTAISQPVPGHYSPSLLLQDNTSDLPTHALPIDGSAQAAESGDADLRNRRIILRNGETASDRPAHPFDYRAEICVLRTDEDDDRNGRWEEAILDTQCKHDIIFKSVVKSLGIEPVTVPQRTYRGLALQKIFCDQHVVLKFTFVDRPDNVMFVDLDVIEDRDVYSTNEAPPFKILLGSYTIARYDMLTPNRQVVPHIHTIIRDM